MIVSVQFLELVEVAEKGHLSQSPLLLHILLKVAVAVVDYWVDLVLLVGAVAVVVIVDDLRCHQRTTTWVDCCIGCNDHVHGWDACDCYGKCGCCYYYGCCYFPCDCYADVIYPSPRYYFHYC